jgi:hypothetical protein
MPKPAVDVASEACYLSREPIQNGLFHPIAFDANWILGGIGVREKLRIR